MDGDLQDEPEIIPEFVAHYQAGADVVYARRRRARKAGCFAAVQRFYRVMSSLSEVHLPLDSGDFALLGPPVVAALRRLARAPALSSRVSGLGRLQTGRRRRGRRARAAGKPKYTTWKLIKLALDGICSFSTSLARGA